MPCHAGAFVRGEKTKAFKDLFSGAARPAKKRKSADELTTLRQENARLLSENTGLKRTLGHVKKANMKRKATMDYSTSAVEFDENNNTGYSGARAAHGFGGGVALRTCVA